MGRIIIAGLFLTACFFLGIAVAEIQTQKEANARYHAALCDASRSALELADRAMDRAMDAAMTARTGVPVDIERVRTTAARVDAAAASVARAAQTVGEACS